MPGNEHRLFPPRPLVCSFELMQSGSKLGLGFVVSVVIPQASNPLMITFVFRVDLPEQCLLDLKL